MISWEEYLTILVDSFREHYDKLSEDKREAAQLNTTFAKPCQIELFSFKAPSRDMLLVSFDSKRPDKQFVIHDKIETDPITYISNRAQSDVVFQEHKRTFMSGLIQTFD